MKKSISFVVAVALALTLYAVTVQPSQASGPYGSGSHQAYYGSGFQGPQYYGNGNYYKLGYGHNARQATSGHGYYQWHNYQKPAHPQNSYYAYPKSSYYDCPNSYYGRPYQPPQAYHQPVHYGYAYGR